MLHLSPLRSRSAVAVQAMQGLHFVLKCGLSSTKQGGGLPDAGDRASVVQTRERQRLTCAVGLAADVSPLPLPLTLPFALPFALPFTLPLPLPLPLLPASLAAPPLTMCGSRRCKNREAPSQTSR